MDSILHAWAFVRPLHSFLAVGQHDTPQDTAGKGAAKAKDAPKADVKVGWGSSKNDKQGMPTFKKLEMSVCMLPWLPHATPHSKV